MKIGLFYLIFFSIVGVLPGKLGGAFIGAIMVASPMIVFTAFEANHRAEQMAREAQIERMMIEEVVPQNAEQAPAEEEAPDNGD